jgi:hypothetical protein
LLLANRWASACPSVAQGDCPSCWPQPNEPWSLASLNTNATSALLPCFVYRYIILQYIAAYMNLRHIILISSVSHAQPLGHASRLGTRYYTVQPPPRPSASSRAYTPSVYSYSGQHPPRNLTISWPQIEAAFTNLSRLHHTHAKRNDPPSFNVPSFARLTRHKFDAQG